MLTWTRLKHATNLLGERLRSLPLLVLYLTDGCNSKCATCDIWRAPRRNMAWGLVEELAQSCEQLGTRWVLLSGGEALQHPEWARIGARFKQTGARVMLLTNGLALAKFADELADSVDEVIVSLDAATPELYQAIRGVDALDVVLEGMRAVRRAGLPLTTRTTVQRANFRQLPQIVRLALAQDATSVSFLAVDVSNDAAFGVRDGLLAPEQVGGAGADLPPHPSALTPAECAELGHIIDQLERDESHAYAQGRMAESPNKLRRILQAYFGALAGVSLPESGIPAYQAPPCNAPHFSTVVEVDGTLRPCYFLPAYGKLRPQGEKLAQALNHPQAQQLRQAYQAGERPECARCVCPLYKSARALWQMDKR